ncbi:hypothetical protein CDCA_CDCA17G4402 [Cyanidium caldarium]|uniref:Alpha 1,4-glycosyltransferase domain-containing protein n=1 Tax=Cyanidium caldarium TaxID=2771 RepID=A0AAV9J196_CYACA|nr:hypothetical protein CDCA_CDCA17G4402 [Cyanidium caldarium]
MLPFSARDMASGKPRRLHGRGCLRVRRLARRLLLNSRALSALLLLLLLGTWHPGLFFTDYSQPSKAYAVLHYDREVELAANVSVAKPPTPVPNTVHFIYGLSEHAENRTFGLMHYLVVKAAHDAIQPDHIYLHYRHQPQGTWYSRAREYLTPMALPNEPLPHNLSELHYAHESDVLRLLLLMKHGGIYLDMDVLALRSFRPLRTQWRVILGTEYVRNTRLVRWPSPGGVANAVIVAPPNATFLHRWLATYATFDRYEWATHSVRVPEALANSGRFDDEVHVAGPRAFYYPTWSPDDAQDGLPRLYSPSGGRRRHPPRYNFSDGNYAVHLWHSKVEEVYGVANIFTLEHLCNVAGVPEPHLSAFQVLARRIYGEC